MLRFLQGSVGDEDTADKTDKTPQVWSCSLAGETGSGQRSQYSMYCVLGMTSAETDKAEGPWGAADEMGWAGKAALRHCCLNKDLEERVEPRRYFGGRGNSRCEGRRTVREACVVGAE